MSRVEETWHHPYGKAWWWQHHVVGVIFSGRAGKLVRIEGKMKGAKVKEILDETLLQSAQDLRLGRRLIFQQDNYPKHTAKTTSECR